MELSIYVTVPLTMQWPDRPGMMALHHKGVPRNLPAESRDKDACLDAAAEVMSILYPSADGGRRSITN